MRFTVVLLALVAACAVAQNDDLVPHDVIIDAAFRYGDDLILITGDEYLAIGSDGIEKYLKVRTGDTHVPVGLDIQAAVHWPSKPRVFFYGNETFFRVNETMGTSHEKKYGNELEFLQGGGPDAIAFLSGHFMTFKGCEYVNSTRTTLTEMLEPPHNVTDLGLPCDVDAAWTSVDKRQMTILKGDNIWTMNLSGDVWGPVPFESMYSIWSWQLKPVPDNRFQL